MAHYIIHNIHMEYLRACIVSSWWLVRYIYVCNNSIDGSFIINLHTSYIYIHNGHIYIDLYLVSYLLPHSFPSYLLIFFFSYFSSSFKTSNYAQLSYNPHIQSYISCNKENEFLFNSTLKGLLCLKMTCSTNFNHACVNIGC